MTDNLDIWAYAAKRQHLSYGNYVAAVERHGLYAPPTKKIYIEAPPKRMCKDCGCAIEDDPSFTSRPKKSLYCHACKQSRRKRYERERTKKV